MVSLAPYPGESNAHAFGRMIVPLCGNGIFFVVPMALVSILPTLAHNFARHGATPANAQFMAQMVLLVAGLTSIVGAPAVTLLTRNFGKRRSLLALLAIYALSGVVGVFEPGFAVLIASRIIIGAASAAIGALSLALIADYYHGPLRFTLFGLSATAQMLLAVIAILLSGWLADRFGWGSVFYVFFFIGLIALIIAWACIIEPPAESVSLIARKISLKAALKPVAPIYLLALIFVIGQLSTVVQGPFLLNLFGVSKASTQGAFGAIPIFAAMVAGAFFGWLHKRVSERPMVIALNLILAMAIIGLGAAHGTGQIIGLYVVIGLVSGIMVPACIAMVVGRAQPGARELSVGLVLSVIGLSGFINPIIARPFTAAFGLRGAFAGIGAILLIQTAILVFGPFARNPPSPTYEDRAETLLDDGAAP